MNEIGPFVDDEPRQLAHVERHAERILHVGGKRRPDPAERLQLADHAPARASDERAAPGLHDGRRHVERRALRPSGVKARQDLQDRAPGEAWARRREGAGSEVHRRGLRAPGRRVRVKDRIIGAMKP
jgi:hypothetical protein